MSKKRTLKSQEYVISCLNLILFGFRNILLSRWEFYFGQGIFPLNVTWKDSHNKT